MKDVAKTAMCSDHNCVFRVAFPELKGGMGTNGGCHCLGGLEREKRIVVGTIIVDYGRLEKRVEELKKALRKIALMPCDCFRNSGCGSCSAREALKTLEAKG